MAGFQSLFAFLHHVVLAKLATSSTWVEDQKGVEKVKARWLG